MQDPGFYTSALFITRSISIGIALATFALALVVYLRRREAGFLMLAVVFAYRLADTVLVAFGINITAMLMRPPMGDRWLLVYLPSIVTLLGWSLLAFRRKKNA